MSEVISIALSSANMFYREVLTVLHRTAIPFLVGGGHAFHHYIGISKPTKDLDLFIQRRDYQQVSAALLKHGYPTELSYPHWLAKVHAGDDFIDLIFSSGNGIAEVDDAWFEHAIEADVLGVPTRLCPVEEMIWSKAFIMERERFDGADIAHLLRVCSERMDWQRLLRRFDPHWRVLFSHLVLFGFAYPGHRDLIPAWLMEELLERLQHEMRAPSVDPQVCAGSLLSREQYLIDIAQWGYQDARVVPRGKMTALETALWTAAIQERHEPKGHH
ncbi:MAG TPA: nucleotidyltransferase [Noviherbaspirillum sp.]|nr:nucleotidyltransferase [Noviherbaspirillum sp.]